MWIFKITMQVVRAVDEAVHSGGKYVNTNLSTPPKYVYLDNLINVYILLKSKHSNLLSAWLSFLLQ